MRILVSTILFFIICTTTALAEIKHPLCIQESTRANELFNILREYDRSADAGDFEFKSKLKLIKPVTLDTKCTKSDLTNACMSDFVEWIVAPPKISGVKVTKGNCVVSATVEPQDGVRPKPPINKVIIDDYEREFGQTEKFRMHVMRLLHDGTSLSIYTDNLRFSIDANKYCTAAQVHKILKDNGLELDWAQENERYCKIAIKDNNSDSENVKAGKELNEVIFSENGIPMRKPQGDGLLDGERAPKPVEQNESIHDLLFDPRAIGV